MLTAGPGARCPLHHLTECQQRMRKKYEFVVEPPPGQIGHNADADERGDVSHLQAKLALELIADPAVGMRLTRGKASSRYHMAQSRPINLGTAHPQQAVAVVRDGHREESDRAMQLVVREHRSDVFMSRAHKILVL